MATLRELLAGARLSAEVEARHEVEILLGHALKRDRAWLFTHADSIPDAAAVDRFRALMAARQRGEPVAYLIGQRGFWTLDLSVTADVLIPRPETELLVELALERIPANADFEVADLGTGSGAIALALASERSHTRILATDASAAALSVASANAKRLEITNVEFAEGDWCAALGSRTFDMIVSNPPYIAVDDAHLTQGDLRYEPASALASGADGLDAIRRLVSDAPGFLKNGGWLLLEHGFDQAERVRQILEANGFSEIHSWKDMAAQDRVSGGRLS